MINKLLILVILLLLLYIRQRFNSGKYFSNESLCGGFLNDVLYDMNSESCQLPCQIKSNFQLLSSQKFTYCGNLSDLISIYEDRIIAKSNVVINQHKVINKSHYRNQKSLKV